VFNNVVFGEAIEIDGSPVSAEENTRDGQEIGQRFCEVVHPLYRLDKSVYCEVPAFTITGAG